MVKYIIFSQRNLYIKSGFVYPLNNDITNLKNCICYDSNIPLNDIISLTNIYGDNYTLFNLKNGNDVYVKITEEYSLYNSIVNLNYNYSNLKGQKEQLEKDLSYVRSDYSSLQRQYNDLQSQYNSNRNQINDLQRQNSTNEQQIRDLRNNNDNLNKELQKEKEIRAQKEQNLQNMKIAFEKSRQVIESKNIEESKKYIEKYIANVFLKEFEVEKEKKSEFKISLTSRMKTFTQEFMNFCHKFINSFKSNTEKIIKEFDIKDNNPIEHINFIVIGRAGVGKSSFINESLLLSENKKAKEGDGISVTKESILYSSDKLKMVRM